MTNGINKDGPEPETQKNMKRQKREIFQMDPHINTVCKIESQDTFYNRNRIPIERHISIVGHAIRFLHYVEFRGSDKWRFPAQKTLCHSNSIVPAQAHTQTHKPWKNEGEF